MMDWLRGKKTYLIAIAMGVASFLGYTPSAEVVGLIEMAQDYIASPQMKLLLEGLGLGALRAGVAKGEVLRK